MPRLRIKSGKEEGRLIEVEENTVTFGRDEESTVILLDNAASRHHAEIFTIGKMVFVKDLDSKNGTFVNNERIKEELLQEGDRVQTAGTVVIFESDHHIDHEQSNVEEDLSAIDFAGPTTEFSLEEIGFGKQENDSTSESLAAIYHLSKIISSERSESALLEKTAALIKDMLSADGIYFFSQDPNDSAKLNLRTKTESDGAALSLVSRSIVKRVLKFGKPILTSDASTDDRFNANESVIVNKIHSTICAPLLSRGRTVGVIYAMKIQLMKTFNEGDLELLTLAGIQTGIATDTFNQLRRERKHMNEMLNVFVAALEMRFPDLKGHSGRVAQYASSIAKSLKLSPRKVRDINSAALIHEIGRLGDQEESAPNENADQKENHTYIAESLLKDISDSPSLLPIIQYQNEHLDGSGFPYKLEGTDIPLEAQILCVANQFDILTSYGVSENESALNSKDALLYLQDFAGQIYREDVCNALQSAYGNGSLFITTKAQ